MKARIQRLLVLVAMLATMAPVPLTRAVRADAPAAVPAVDQAKVVNVVPADAPAAVPEIDQARVTDKLKQKNDEKTASLAALGSVPTMGGARPHETVDTNQVSIAEPLSKGELKLEADTSAAFAYVQPYQEPNDPAYNNYCGPGAAVGVLSHWDPNLPNSVDLDTLGKDMDMDPSSGVWVYKIVKPVNDRLNKVAGKDVNWYKYGEAETLEDFRYIIKTDLQDHGVPFITSLQTAGLPGWGQQDVGHIVAVYGYTRAASGAEFITYMDTAGPTSGYKSDTQTHTVPLGTFWHAVEQNSAQVW